MVVVFLKPQSLLEQRACGCLKLCQVDYGWKKVRMPRVNFNIDNFPDTSEGDVVGEINEELDIASSIITFENMCETFYICSIFSFVLMKNILILFICKFPHRRIVFFRKVEKY